MAELDKKNTVEGYDLNLPNKQMAIKSIEGIYERQKAEEVWLEICAESEVMPDSNNIDELSKIFANMSKKEGTLGVLGRSLSIKVTSYRILSRIKNIK